MGRTQRSRRQGRAGPARAGAARPPARRRSGPGIVGAVAIAAVVLFAVGAAMALANPRESPASSAPSGSDQIGGEVTLGPGQTMSTQPIDGITCTPSVSVAYHARVHLAIVVDGAAREIPKGIGIPGTCLYWIHTYESGGVVDVEAPARQAFTLGQFFDIWGQPLTPTTLGPYSGATSDRRYAYLNGSAWTADPRDLPLADGSVIELQLGASPTTPATFSFPPA